MSDLLSRYARALLAIDVLLVLAHLAVGHHPSWNLDKEHNPPTWFASMQLALVALTALDVQLRERTHENRFYPPTWAWFLVAVSFFYLSLDEATVLHEGLWRHDLRDLLPADSLWISLLPWQVIFGPFLAILLMLVLGLFLTRSPAAPGILGPALGGLGCWAGAVLAEGLAKPLFMARDWYSWEVALEEGLELLGATLLLVALARYGAALARYPIRSIELGAQARQLALAGAATAFVIAAGVVTVVVVSSANATWLYRHNADQLAKRGKYREAITAYDRVIEESPRNLKAHARQALAYAKVGEYESALAGYDRALAIREDARLSYERARVLAQLKRFEEAIRGYQRAIALDPKYGRALSGLGRSLEKLGRREEALEAYRRALALDPRDRSARAGVQRLG